MKKPPNLSRLLIAICAFGALGVLGGGTAIAQVTGPAVPDSTASNPFCEGVVLHNYQRPLQSMLPIKRIPAKGGVQFKGHRVDIAPLSALVVGGGGSVGFEANAGISSEPDNRKLDWRIRITLDRVTASGRLKQVTVKRKREFRVRSLADFYALGDGLWFPVKGKPAFYRSAVTFIARDGTRKRFSEYFRVVRRTVSISLRTDASAYAQGKTGFARINNWGTARVTFGYALEIDSYQSEHWVEVISLPAPAVAIEMPGGIASGCAQFRIPEEFTPGRYRLRREVGIVGSRRPRVLTAVFDVISR